MGIATASEMTGITVSYLRDIARYKPLSAEEEQELARRIQKGDKRALEELVRANLRFVVSVARNYLNQGLPLLDLINEGNIGLVRAAHRFDASKNFKFISYAVWWIRQAILQALARQSRIVNVPLNRVGTVYQVGKARERLEQRFARKPTNREIAQTSELSEQAVADAHRIAKSSVSLDSHVGDEGRTSLAELVLQDKVNTPDLPISEESYRQAIQKALEVLPPRESNVIRLYFGLGEDTTYTLDEIGARLHLTRERVRQIKDRALSALRKECTEYLREVVRMN